MANNNDSRFGDERNVKRGADARSSRESADASRVQQDGSALTSAQRRKLIRQEWVQNVLPTPPEIPGYHLCWVSTTNATDPVHKRIQLGYIPVKANEVPGLEQYTVGDEGQFQGCVQCNEMLLFKIPMEVYQDIMAIYHHDIPLEQEQSIRDRVKSHADRDSEGRELSHVEGDFDKLGKAPAAPPQFA